ncbi:MAG: lamin tail domain-containing protein [Ignavibacteriaceae bacterium]|nr:lamin tail domain-containing protein [Ignavibacteriaceae bacterium]
MKQIFTKLALFLLLIVFNESFAQTSPVKMNEIYSRGTTAAPDWIELYNDSSNPVDISNYKIYDNGGQSATKPKKGFPSGTVIPAKGFYVVVTDGSDTSDFGLSSSGEEVWLEDSAGTIIQDINFPALKTGESYSRVPDGGNTWVIQATQTKGSSNGSGPVKMNEIYSRGTDADPDWIELYNNSSDTLDISSYKIYDIGGQGGTKPKKVFAAGTKISPKGFYVVVTDGPDTSDFGLSSSGEEVWLEDANGTVIQDISFPALKTGESYCRVPDGADNWKILATQTKGASNVTSSIVMNEIYSRGTDTDPDWIELYNNSTDTVDISKYKIYDIGGQGGTKPKKDFAAGTKIPPKGFYVVVTDGPDTSNFGLSSSGEEVWLEDSTATVIQDISFPALQTGESYCRVPDGSGTWEILTTQTKGTSNGTSTAVTNSNKQVTEYRLSQNYPNPFNPSTTISFTLPNEGHAKLEVFNVLGKCVSTLLNAKLNTGSYQVVWKANLESSGIYFYKLSVQSSEGKGFIQIKKMLLIK